MSETKSSLTIRIDARLREQMEQVRREIVPAESQTTFIERAIKRRIIGAQGDALLDRLVEAYANDFGHNDCECCCFDRTCVEVAVAWNKIKRENAK
jgi:4-aminobutyrate aminotransferase-like enzyme